MKKLMFVAAAALCGSLFAEGEITSANIVGYKAETLVGNDYSMVGVQFHTAAGENIDLNKDVLISGTISGEYWPDGDVIDDIQIYVNGEGWASFYFNLDQEKWVNEDGDTSFEARFPNGLPVGTTMWFNANPNVERAEMPKITFSGAIASPASITIAGVANDDYSMISNPYPVSYDINDKSAVVFGGTISGEYWPDGDIIDDIQIYVNGEGWASFYYNLDQEKWVNEDGDTTFESRFPNGTSSSWWFNANPNAIRTEDVSITFLNPVKD